MLLKSRPSGIDYLIVGLGNPGLEYEKTRHNIGFHCLDVLCENLHISCNRMKFNSYLGDGEIGQKRCLFLKPLTYMNLSGEAVAAVMRFYKLQPEQLIVIYDDISLDVGRMRIRLKGSAGGHNGIKNIIEQLGSDVFSRIKIGVGQKPHPDYDLKNWVLGKFPPEQNSAVQAVIRRAADAAICLVQQGADAAMSRYNN